MAFSVECLQDGYSYIKCQVAIKSHTWNKKCPLNSEIHSGRQKKKKDYSKTGKIYYSSKLVS